MELIVKVNVKKIEGKNGNKFDVYNTYIKDEENSEWVKFNVKFKQGVERPVVDSYVYADESEISINEIGNYPTIFINRVNKIVKLRFDSKNLQKYFKAVDDKTFVDEIEDEMKNADTDIFDSPVEEKDLPFDKKDNKND